MIKIQSGKVKFHGNTKIGASSAGPSNLMYFYSPTNDYDGNKWFKTGNWWSDVNHSVPATGLPIVTTDVVIIAPVAPIADLDLITWVQPHTINTGTVGMNFTSVLSGNVSCDITGPVSFSGSVTFNK